MPTRKFEHVSIIYNPNSTGDAKQNSLKLQTALRPVATRSQIELVETQHAGHATELAYQAAKKYPHGLVISASGDGGYNEVINGILRAQAEGSSAYCAVEPSGNANDHARTTHDRPLADLIIDGRRTSMDVLEVTVDRPNTETRVRYVHSYVGLGLTPAVAAELDRHHFSSIGEALMLLKTFWKLRPVKLQTKDYSMRKPGTSKVDCVVWSIVPQMAKVFTLSSQAKPDDGKYEMTVLPHHQKIKLLYHMLRGIFSSMQATSRTKDFSCTVLQDTPIQYDGEVERLFAGTILTVRVKPGLLKTIA